MSSRALSLADTQNAWDLALPGTSGDFSEPVVTSKKSGRAINALASKTYRAQGNSLKEAAKYNQFNRCFRTAVAPQFKILEEISTASTALSPLVSVLVERIQDLLDGRVFFYIDTTGEVAKVSLLEKADTSPSGEESHKARALEATTLLSIELRQSAALREELIKLAEVVEKLKNCSLAIIESAQEKVEDSKVAFTEHLGRLEEEIDKATELTEVADIGLESIHHFFKSLIDWIGITPRLATFCTRGYRDVVRLEGQGRSAEVTPAMRIAHSIHDAAGRARKPDVDFCLEKAFKTVAYMYQFYGMIGQSAESLSKLSDYERQRYWIIMQFCSLAQKGRLKDLPKSDMLFLTLVLSSELNGLSLAYKRGGKRALTQAVTYKALDMLETYAVDYCVKQLLKRSKIESRLGFLSPAVRSGLLMLVEIGSSAAISGCFSDWKRKVALMMPDLLFGADDTVKVEKPSVRKVQ